jgi:hypothetical protein
MKNITQNVDNYAGTSPICLHLRLLANTLCAQYSEAALHCYESTTALISTSYESTTTLISTSLFHKCKSFESNSSESEVIGTEREE